MPVIFIHNNMPVLIIHNNIPVIIIHNTYMLYLPVFYIIYC